MAQAGLLWLAKHHPGKRHAYITYSESRAEYVSRKVQALAEIAGLEPKGRLSDVQLKGGTEIRFTSIGGSLTGFPVDGLLMVDDPVKDRVDAESPTIRRNTVDWFIDVARSRRHPKTSIICMATRWHPEDLSGELIGRGYEYINLKAIAEGPIGLDGRIANDPLHRFPGEALFPALKPASFFEEEQQDAYSWSSLYQGEPRGRGASVFEYPDLANSSRTYETLPDDSTAAPLRWSIGCDFAYTAKTHADYSVAVVLMARAGVYYVLDVVRAQDEARHFRDRIKHLSQRYPRARASAYVASTEQGGVEFIRDGGLDIDGLSAAKAGDKFTRALPVAAAWNSGKILLPKSAPWLDAFLSEVCSFTGVKDRHDDQVDALAGAFDGIMSATSKVDDSWSAGFEPLSRFDENSRGFG